MEVITLKSCRDAWFDAFLEIYSISFPVFEQRTGEQQQQAFLSPLYFLDCYIEEGEMIGFIAYWKLDTYVYVEHFAIHPAKRGQTWGSFIIEDLIGRMDNRVILEIDPLIDEISKKRFRFYRTHGFFENPYPHFHPPYRKGNAAHSLVVLSTKGKMGREEYELFARDLAQIIMK